MGILGDLRSNANEKLGKLVTNTRNLGRQLSPFKNTRPLFAGEKHLPFHNYSGPFTHLEERLARGDKPVDELDSISMKHDIAYSKAKIPADIEKADKIFTESTKHIKGNILQKAGGYLVGELMQGKRIAEKLGLHDVNKWITKK